MSDGPAEKAREGDVVHDRVGVWEVRHYGEDYVFLVGLHDQSDPDDQLTLTRVMGRALFDAAPWRTPLDEQVTYFLERTVDGVWTAFTAHKTDPAEVVRTYDFAARQDSEREVRIAEVRVGVSLVDRADVEALVPSTADKG